MWLRSCLSKKGNNGFTTMLLLWVHNDRFQIEAPPRFLRQHPLWVRNGRAVIVSSCAHMDAFCLQRVLSWEHMVAGVKCSHKVGLNSQIIGLVLVIPESFKNISRSASVLMPWSGWIPDSDWLQDACRYYWLFVRTEQSEMMSPIENNLLPAPVEGGQFSCHFYPRCWCCHIGHYHCCSSVVISKGKIVL